MLILNFWILLIISQIISQSNKVDQRWHLLVEDKLATVYAEKILYRKAGQEHFFVHLRIQNKTNASIGVDLSHYYKVIHPNQWGTYPEPERGVIDEIRMTPEKADPLKRGKLTADFKAGSLTLIKSNEAADYYREFSASTPEDVNRSQGKYLIISLDGELFITDGETVEVAALEWSGATNNAKTDLMIPFPIEWKEIPDNALIVERHQGSR